MCCRGEVGKNTLAVLGEFFALRWEATWGAVICSVMCRNNDQKGGGREKKKEADEEYRALLDFVFHFVQLSGNRRVGPSPSVALARQDTHSA